MLRNCPQDWISELPEELKLHILKLLPRKSAIRTGVLSLRWKNLWKKRFDYPTTIEFTTNYVNEETQQVFIQRMMEQLPQIEAGTKMEFLRFCFSIPRGCEKEVFYWISKAVSCSAVEDVTLDFSQSIFLRFPGGSYVYRGRRPELRDFLFKDNTISRLTLRYSRLPKRSKFVNFKGLESLKLHAVNITTLMFDRVLSSCINLKTLVVSRCDVLQKVIIDRQNSPLQNLCFYNCRSLTSLKIVAINLLKLCVEKVGLHILILENVSSLVELTLFASNRASDICVEWKIDLSRMMLLVTLGLSHEMLQYMLSHGEQASLALPSLRSLTLRMVKVDAPEILLIHKLFALYFVPSLVDFSLQPFHCSSDRDAWLQDTLAKLQSPPPRTQLLHLIIEPFIELPPFDLLHMLVAYAIEWVAAPVDPNLAS